MKKGIILSLILALSIGVFAQNDITEIYTAEELAAINASESSMEGTYILMNNLIVDNWTPIGGIDGAEYRGFMGTFDGNGHTVTINSFNGSIDNTHIGLFGLIGEEGLVKNLRVAGKVNYTGGQKFLYIGGIAGLNRGSIKFCVSSIDLTCDYVKSQAERKLKAQSGYETGRYGGCIAGVNIGLVIHSYSDGSIKVSSSTYPMQRGVAAGIAGCNGSPIKGSFGISIGSGGVGVSAAPGAPVKQKGGIGYCYSTASVYAANACGIAGYNHPESAVFNNCVALNHVLEARNAPAPKATPYTVAFSMAITHPNFQFHFRDDIVTRQYNDKGIEKPAKFSDKCAIAFSTTQTESWWRMPDGLPEDEHKKVLGFPFGTDEESPWKWDDNLKRPVLYWE